MLIALLFSFRTRDALFHPFFFSFFSDFYVSSSITPNRTVFADITTATDFQANNVDSKALSTVTDQIYALYNR